MPYLPENAKDTLCRNVTIYGRCRYEDKGIGGSSSWPWAQADLDVQAVLSTMTHQSSMHTRQTGEYSTLSGL